jgi:hypothetical protein
MQRLEVYHVGITLQPVVLDFSNSEKSKFGWPVLLEASQNQSSWLV